MRGFDLKRKERKFWRENVSKYDPLRVLSPKYRVMRKHRDKFMRSCNVCPMACFSIMYIMDRIITYPKRTVPSIMLLGLPSTLRITVDRNKCSELLRVSRTCLYQIFVELDEVWGNLMRGCHAKGVLWPRQG